MRRLLYAACLGLGLMALAARADAATFVALDSEPGELIQNGQDAVLTPPDWNFEPIEYVLEQGVVSLRLRGSGRYLEFEFRVAPGAPLIGATHVAVEHPAGAANPVIRVSSNSQACVFPGEGAFRVFEAEAVNGQTPSRLALDFQVRCPGSTGVLRGAIRINSDVPATPADPAAVASGPAYVNEGDTVTLDGRWTWKAAAPISSYSWQQVSGPAVTLSDPAAVRPTFVAIANSGQLSALTFELTVTDGDGNASGGQVTVNAYDVAAPQTFLALQSDPGEFVLGGESYLFRLPDMPLAWRNLDATRSSYVAGIDLPGTIVGVTFGGPDGVPLGADRYLGAVRMGNQAPTMPGLSLYGFARGCNAELGFFVIYEIETDPGSGALTRLAMDFERRCTGNNPENPARAFGQLRINSLRPRVVPAPLAVAGTDQTVSEMESVALDGQFSRGGTNPIEHWRWTQVEGPTVTLDRTNREVAHFTAPAVPSGSVDLVFELQVTDTAGHTGTDRVRITVVSLSVPRNLLHIESSPGDFVGGGLVATFDDDDGAFVVDPVAAEPGAAVVGFQAGANRFNMRFAAPAGRSLVADNYEDTESGGDLSPLRPSLEVGSDGRGCSAATGRFVVREIVRDAGGHIGRLAVDFTQYCGGSSAPLFGAVRYRSSVPLEPAKPTASAGGDQDVLERDAVVLDGRQTMPGTSTVSSWRWRQLAGTPVTLVDSRESIATFAAPAVDAAGETLQFELRAENTDGLVDTDVVDVHVTHKVSPRSVAFIIGDGYRYARDQLLVLQPQDGVFSARDIELPSNETVIDWHGVADDWDFVVLTPGPLAVGHYEIDGVTGLPGLDISSGGNGCSHVGGSFDILDIAIESDHVSRIAMNFEQECDIPGVVLRGKLRFNVAIPDANAGPDLEAEGRERVTLSADASEPAIGTLNGYAWRQLAGPAVTLQNAGVATASFTAPDVATATTLTFELAVTDDRGIDDSDIVAVEVTPASTPPPPPPPSGGGGGGGAVSWPLLAALTLLARLRRDRTRGPYMLR